MKREMKRKFAVSLLLLLIVVGNYAAGLYGEEKESKNLEIKIYNLNYVPSEVAKEKVLELMKSLSPEEIDFCYYSNSKIGEKDLTRTRLSLHKGRKLYVDKERDSLLVSDTSPNQKLISKLIKELDRPRPQFLIKFIRIFLPTKEGQGWGGSIGETRIVALEGIPAKIDVEADIWFYHCEVVPVLKKDGKISLKINSEIKKEGKVVGHSFFPDFTFESKEIHLLTTFIIPGCEREGMKGEIACGILVYVEKLNLLQNKEKDEEDTS